MCVCVREREREREREGGREGGREGERERASWQKHNARFSQNLSQRVYILLQTS